MPHSLTLAAAREKIGWVRDAAGERFDSLEFNVYPSTWPVTVTDDLRGEARRVLESLRSRTGVELTEQQVIDSPHLFIGSVNRLVEKFEQLREELGITSFMVGDQDDLSAGRGAACRHLTRAAPVALNVVLIKTPVARSASCSERNDHEVRALNRRWSPRPAR